MLKLNCLQFVCLLARPLTRGGFWTMKLMIRTKTESCIIGPLLFLMAAFLFLFLFLFFFFWGGGGWERELQCTLLTSTFSFHISTCIPRGVFTPLAKGKEKFMSGKALIMIPKILGRIEMSIR